MSSDELEAIHQIYDFYDILEGQPHTALNLDEGAPCEQAIHDAYDEVQQGGRLSDLRNILLASVTECPYCGYAEATTLDHYLPKAKFPALAIYPRNLVPACQPCNGAKSSHVPLGTEGFIHAYFMDFPGEIFLHANVSYNNGALVVEFHIENSAIDKDILKRLRFQLGRLKLNERYLDQINTFLFDLEPSIKFFMGLPEPASMIESFFSNSAQSYVGTFGLNHWKTALIRGLKDSIEFCSDPGPYFQIGRIRVQLTETAT